MILGRILLKDVSIGFWARCKQQWKNSWCYLAKSMWKEHFPKCKTFEAFTHQFHESLSTNLKSSLKINQMHLCTTPLLLSNYLDFVPSRKGCLAMITIAIHKRFHTEIFARIVNNQLRTKRNWSAQKMLLHAVCRSQVFPTSQPPSRFLQLNYVVVCHTTTYKS